MGISTRTSNLRQFQFSRVDLFAKLLQFSELTGNIAELLWAVRHLLISKPAELKTLNQLNRDVIDADQSDA
jgi:hypothetical protein